jgi:hypothetical protein
MSKDRSMEAAADHRAEFHWFHGQRRRNAALPGISSVSLHGMTTPAYPLGVRVDSGLEFRRIGIRIR